MRCTCAQENPSSADRCERCGRPLRSGVRWAALLDVAAAVGLVVALAVVYWWDKEYPAKESGAPRLRLAVTPPEYDDMGKLLATLGAGYPFTSISYDDLLQPGRLSSFDVVFLTCGGVPRHWVGRRLGESGRDAAGIFELRRDIQGALCESLREFVSRGGTLYVSDLQFQLLERAFPEFTDRRLIAEGDVQTVRAEVVDRGLRRRLGETIPLHFDKPAWRPAAFSAPDLIVYLRGEFETTSGQRTSAPLLVQWPFHEGTIIFTAFHNERQNTETERELLRYLVFASVTAREGARVHRTLVRGGFSPAERNLLSASAGSQPVTQQYECRGAGPLQFVLGFQKHRARLRLTVEGPDGTRREKTGEETFEIEIPEAAQGAWRYTIAPLEVPYPHFPFTLTIGERGRPQLGSAKDP